MSLSKKQGERDKEAKFILDNGFAEDVPGHSLVLMPKGHELLTTLSNLNAGIDNKSKASSLSLGTGNGRRAVEKGSRN